MSTSDLTYALLLHGPIEPTMDYLNKLPTEILSEYMRKVYQRTIVPTDTTAMRVYFSLSIPESQDERMDILEQTILEYYEQDR